MTLVGGFLGAGKTTLVNRLISSDKKRYGVVINEFGDTGVDAALIENLEGDGVAELEGGCLCCVGREDLAGTLYGLLCREHLPEYMRIPRVLRRCASCPLLPLKPRTAAGRATAPRRRPRGSGGVATRPTLR